MDEPLEKAWKLHPCMDKMLFSSGAQTAMRNQGRGGIKLPFQHLMGHWHHGSPVRTEPFPLCAGLTDSCTVHLRSARMPNSKLTKLMKDKSKMIFFAGYLKQQKMENFLDFITAKPKPEAIYDLYMSKKPKVKLPGLDTYRKNAQRAYIQAVQAELETAQERGEQLSRNDAHYAGSRSPGVMDAFNKAQAHAENYVTNQAIPNWKKSHSYENYVGTQVDGSSLASKLKYPPIAGQHLADAKVNLMLGKAGLAKSCVDLAIKAKMDKEMKGENPRHAVAFPKTADVIKELDKVRIAV
ncbi:hypothetical protein [uncultured Tateyamaria sp.]|uniref:hypothetical protein n=1 Tax=uncultured Tateyamaria sp. TaxID=455651 RepID=UPI00262B050A|nr:hypothetical protein [uncultured Tateyamaria sp.]